MLAEQGVGVVASWTMPAETAPQERVWMAWPVAGYTLGSTGAEEAWRTWAAVANAVAEYQPVSMLVDPSTSAEASRWLSSSIEQHPRELNDAWYRDTGPTFVLGEDGSLGAVRWAFNGWGQQEWAAWDLDREAGEVAVEASGAIRIGSELVNEGGGIHTDGEGTFLVTRTVQLDPHRNPGWREAEVEAELARTLGARKVIWLSRGLTRDSQTYGTRGHVDIVATFSEPGRILLHHQGDTGHPDYQVTDLLRAELLGCTDAAGRRLEVVDVPAPVVTRDAEGFVDYSYINHLVINGAVISCSFGDPHDARAAGLLAEAYPGRKIVAIEARPLFARGGGIHCITQQQPATPVDHTGEGNRR